MRVILAALALALVFSRPAAADDMADIVITTPGERTVKNEAVIGGIAGAAVVVGAIGLYFHLDSKSTADQVSSHTFTGLPWTPDRQQVYDRAASSATKATVAYSIGGALLVGAVVAFLVTDPKSDTTIIHPHRSRPTPTVEPAPGGGAMLGGMWSF